MCFPALSARDFLERAKKGKVCKGMNTGNKSENQMFILDKKKRDSFFFPRYINMLCGPDYCIAVLCISGQGEEKN